MVDRKKFIDSQITVAPYDLTETRYKVRPLPNYRQSECPIQLVVTPYQLVLGPHGDLHKCLFENNMFYIRSNQKFFISKNAFEDMGKIIVDKFFQYLTRELVASIQDRIDRLLIEYWESGDISLESLDCEEQVAVQEDPLFQYYTKDF